MPSSPALKGGASGTEKPVKLTEFLADIGRPVGYYPKLTKITGGVKETILLCQLLYWVGKQENGDGWIYKTQEEIEEETGLSRREQETARRNLREIGFLEEKYAGIPRKLYFRVNFEKVNETWQEFITNRPTNNNVQNVQTRMYETCKQACTKRADKNARNVQANYIDYYIDYTETTSENNIISSYEEISQNSPDGDGKTEVLPTPPNNPPPINANDIVRVWNEVCGSTLPKAIKLTEERKKKIRARLAAGPERLSLDWWRDYFRRIRESPFLTGDNDRGWRADFDWAIRSETVVTRVLEGRYERRKQIPRAFASLLELKAELEEEEGNDMREKGDFPWTGEKH